MPQSHKPHKLTSVIEIAIAESIGQNLSGITLWISLKRHIIILPKMKYIIPNIHMSTQVQISETRTMAHYAGLVLVCDLWAPLGGPSDLQSEWCTF